MTGEIPESGEQQGWDIPLDEGVFTSSRVPRPDPANHPRIEIYARLLAAVGALFLAGAFLMWIYLADDATLASLFFDGSLAVTKLGLLKLAGITATGTVIVYLALYPVMRALVQSKIAPRTLDRAQHAVLEMVPGPVFFLNADARLEEINAAFAKAVGRSANAIIGRSIYDFVPAEQQEDVYKQLVKVTSREIDGFRCPILTDRAPRTFHVQAEPYQGHNSETPHIIGVALDLTNDLAETEAIQSKYQHLHAATLQTLEAVAHVAETRDPYLHGHHERVAKLACALAKQLDLSEEEIEGIELAARAHDIGTIKIPFEIQIKPGALSDAESSLIEEHSQTGADMLARIDFPWPVGEMIVQHHEFIDGSGYPKGLKGKEIVLGARIIAVADAYDALTSHRPYRAAISRAEALQRLMSLSGRNYDPRVVTALSKVLQQANTEF